MATRNEIVRFSLSVDRRSKLARLEVAFKTKESSQVDLSSKLASAPAELFMLAAECEAALALAALIAEKGFTMASITQSSMVIDSALKGGDAARRNLPSILPFAAAVDALAAIGAATVKYSATVDDVKSVTATLSVAEGAVVVAYMEQTRGAALSWASMPPLYRDAFAESAGKCDSLISTFREAARESATRAGGSAAPAVAARAPTRAPAAAPVAAAAGSAAAGPAGDHAALRKRENELVARKTALSLDLKSAEHELGSIRTVLSGGVESRLPEKAADALDMIESLGGRLIGLDEEDTIASQELISHELGEDMLRHVKSVQFVQMLLNSIQELLAEGAEHGGDDVVMDVIELLLELANITALAPLVAGHMLPALAYLAEEAAALRESRGLPVDLLRAEQLSGAVTILNELGFEPEEAELDAMVARLVASPTVAAGTARALRVVHLSYVRERTNVADVRAQLAAMERCCVAGVAFCAFRALPGLAVAVGATEEEKEDVAAGLRAVLGYVSVLVANPDFDLERDGSAVGAVLARINAAWWLSTGMQYLEACDRYDPARRNLVVLERLRSQLLLGIGPYLSDQA